VHVVHRSFGQPRAELRGVEPVEVMSCQFVEAFRPECRANLLVDLAPVFVQRFRRPSHPLPMSDPLVEQHTESRRARTVAAPLHFGNKRGELLGGFAPSGPRLSSRRDVRPTDLLRLSGYRVLPEEHAKLPTSRCLLPHRARHEKGL
jgi:hypothetical protein